jgi:phosphoribosylformylglycinamidine synthase subunit PurSL
MSQLWEVEVHPGASEIDREAETVVSQARGLGVASIQSVRTARSFLVEGDLSRERIEGIAGSLLTDPIVERTVIRQLPSTATESETGQLLTVLFKAGVTDNVAESVKSVLVDLGHPVTNVRTGKKFWFNPEAQAEDVALVGRKVLSNDAIQYVVNGPLALRTLALGQPYTLALATTPICELNDAGLAALSKTGQLYLSLTEMQTIQAWFRGQGREPTDIELETIAQTWSEHCSHKTLGGRVHYTDPDRDIQFTSMLKETIFAATKSIRAQLGPDDWCVSVFKDNAGVIKFDDEQHVCFKVETHNHPSALDPYGGANTGLGGVIRDPLGTGLGAKPICNTDVFCFAPPDTPHASLPPGVLHPKAVMKGVVSGVRDYGNRMGIPTVNGAIYFDERYLGNPLVYCGNVAMIPVDKVEKSVVAGDYIVALGGRTGRDGIHGATFSSAELTDESESLSGGAVQIGNAITEKMLMDVLLAARDLGLYRAVTDCGAGGFSSAVGEMGAESGAVVWLEKAPLKYAGLTYTEIWISEAQERMVLAVAPAQWEQFRSLCAAEGVEATVIGEFTDTGRLVLTYAGTTVGDLPMSLLHDGRPPVVREATYTPPAVTPFAVPTEGSFTDDLMQILGSLNVCSKEWVIRQYDHEVQAGSVVKPLVGVQGDGPSDAAVVRPNLRSWKGLAISNGMNPRLGDLDPYWMAASAIDEAVRNCIAVGADPDRIAILDNFCWGNTDRAETLGSLTRAALACYDVAIAFGTPFISGKDSLNNEFSYEENKVKRTVAIPSSLLISALGIVPDVRKACTMDLKEAGNTLYLVGVTRPELGGSHLGLVRGLTGGDVPKVDLQLAPRLFRGMHQVIGTGAVVACHDLSEGGLAVALAEMSFAGELGVTVKLSANAYLPADPAVALFSESNTRWVIEVRAGRESAVEAAFEGLPLTRLGSVMAGRRIDIDAASGTRVISAEWSALKAAWQKPLQWA